MQSQNIGKSKEDYLEAILMQIDKNGACRVTDVANQLGFSKPSVSVALKKLEDDGWEADAGTKGKEYKSEKQEKIIEGVGYCHGSYSYHNVIITEEGIATVNFDSFHVGFQLVDLYQFTRKVIEKTGYRLETARRIIEAYGQAQPLTAKDHEYIYILLKFPEKFWKVSNHYINSRKSWISPVNIEKTRKIIEHEQEKQKFLNDFSCYFGVHKITK